MRWILLSMLLAAPSLAGEPPFSDIRRRPALNPYLRMDEGLFLPYQMEILPRTQGREAVPPRTNPRATRPVMPPHQGIRPTGHPTHFMIFRFS